MVLPRIRKAEIAHPKLEEMTDETFKEWAEKEGFDTSQKITWVDDHKSNVRIFTQEKPSKRR